MAFVHTGFSTGPLTMLASRRPDPTGRPRQLLPVSSHATQSPRRVQLVFILGALSAFGPLSIDMYLPALPSLSRDFGTGASQTQLTLSACLLGLALGLDPKDLGLNRHVVKPTSVIDWTESVIAGVSA